MTTGTAIVINPTGLHARPAATFAAAAATFKATFKATVKIKNLDSSSEAVSAKSIVRVLTLSAGCGTKIEISADGDDEQTAVETLVGLVDSGFGGE